MEKGKKILPYKGSYRGEGVNFVLYTLNQYNRYISFFNHCLLTSNLFYLDIQLIFFLEKKMKSIITVFAIILSVDSFASSSLECRTLQKVSGWKGTDTFDYVYFTATIASNSLLNNAEVSGAYDSDKRDISSDSKYQPKSPLYTYYHKFGALEDAWNWFSPLLPKNVLNLKSKRFPGYLQIMGEQGYKGTLKLDCVIK